MFNYSRLAVRHVVPIHNVLNVFSYPYHCNYVIIHPALFNMCISDFILMLKYSWVMIAATKWFMHVDIAIKVCLR